MSHGGLGQGLRCRRCKPGLFLVAAVREGQHGMCGRGRCVDSADCSFTCLPASNCLPTGICINGNLLLCRYEDLAQAKELTRSHTAHFSNSAQQAR